MKIIKNPKEMQKEADLLRARGKTIGFVPTMGYLHEGHLSLLDKARKLSDVVVLSIFVNPTQFAPGEDLDKYPRDFERDERLAKERQTDIIYYPDAASMYPQGYQTEVQVTKLQKVLCGIDRPIHFKGVATVCAKLFNIVKPHYAVFGAKDYQQYLVVDRMVRDLNMDLQIVPGEIYRESDGLAMSSRNVYLTDDERKQAIYLSKSLKIAREMVEKGERSAAAILDAVKTEVQKANLGKIDYIELKTIPNLENAGDHLIGPTLLALAVKFSIARLIDNTVLLGHIKPA